MSKRFRSILVFGPPGSGKGTLGKVLAESGRHVHLSSGDIFRSLSPDSPIGKIFHQYAGKGQLVPDSVTIDVWKHYVQGLIETNAYLPDEQFLLLDGIPRTIAQANLLDPLIEVMQIIVLDIQSIDTLLYRMKKRSRGDDVNEEVLRTRFRVYQEDTMKLLSHYPKELISRFNAEQKPIEVLRDVLVKLTPLLAQSK